jgi:peptide deformylase
VTKLFDFENPQVDQTELEETLTSKMKEYKVIGLSANQEGYDVRVFAMNSDDKGIVFFYNPEIRQASRETELMKEGDARYPDVFINLRRPKSIEIEYKNSKGEKQTLWLEGVAARCALHEIDALNNVEFLHRASKLKLQRALDKKRKQAKRNSKINALMGL